MSNGDNMGTRVQEEIALSEACEVYARRMTAFRRRDHWCDDFTELKQSLCYHRMLAATFEPSR